MASQEKTPQWLGFHQGINRMNTERRSWDREEVCPFLEQMKTILSGCKWSHPETQ